MKSRKMAAAIRPRRLTRKPVSTIANVANVKTAQRIATNTAVDLFRAREGRLAEVLRRESYSTALEKADAQVTKD
jgi:hypothetical protein